MVRAFIFISLLLGIPSFSFAKLEGRFFCDSAFTKAEWDLLNREQLIEWDRRVSELNLQIRSTFEEETLAPLVLEAGWLWMLYLEQVKEKSQVLEMLFTELTLKSKDTHEPNPYPKSIRALAWEILKDIKAIHGMNAKERRYDRIAEREEKNRMRKKEEKRNAREERFSG